MQQQRHPQLTSLLATLLQFVPQQEQSQLASLKLRPPHMPWETSEIVALQCSHVKQT